MGKQREQRKIMKFKFMSPVDNPFPLKLHVSTVLKTFVTFRLFLATNEIDLPGEVQESLLSQLSDAKEIVLQLRENMQLEQASLEQPDSKTKTMIRCLARKSKDSKRLDLFQYLRDITPAGTTGEFGIIEVLCYQFPIHICYYALLKDICTCNPRSIYQNSDLAPRLSVLLVFI